jgi:NAD(P)-dependent dehydrogenase (short-subunit alcohol dehydrogenase family)
VRGSPAIGGRTTVKLEGKVVALTGAAGALGSALARGFAAEGVKALVLVDVAAEQLEDLRIQLESRGAQARGASVDVTDAQAVDRLVEATVGEFGRLDVMINNAGILNRNGRIHNLDDDEWRRVIDVNLMGTLHGMRAALRVMRKQEGGGSIVNTASTAGLTAWPYASAYGATKAAVIQLTKVAAVEYARERVRVNCVCPGTFVSNIHAGLPQEALDAIAARHPLGLGRAEDLVGAFVYLASDDARWTTGTTLVVDGGYSAP